MKKEYALAVMLALLATENSGCLTAGKAQVVPTKNNPVNHSRESAASRGDLTKYNGNVSVSTFVSSGKGAVNSHLIETAEGIVLIDAQRVDSETQKLLQQIKAINKPLLAVLLTHAHPDHFGGLPLIAAAYPNALVYASPASIEIIKTDKGGLIKLTEQNYKEDFNEKVVVPNRAINASEEFVVGGIIIRSEEIGAGEVESSTFYYLPSQNILFTGDLMNPSRTPFLLEGRSNNWLKQLNYAKLKYSNVKTVYPGHGTSGAAGAVIDNQREYLETFRRLIAEKLKSDNGVTPSEKQAIKQEVERRYPDYSPVSAITDIIGLNIDAVSKEMQAGAEHIR